MFNLNNLRKFFTSRLNDWKEFFMSLFTSRQKIDYVESNDYPIFKIDGKQYYVDLKNSQLALRTKMKGSPAYYFKTRDTNKKRIIIATVKRTYLIPSLVKALGSALVETWDSSCNFETKSGEIVTTSYGW